MTQNKDHLGQLASLLQQYQTWEENRTKIAIGEADGIYDAGAWRDSDDSGVELLRNFFATTTALLATGDDFILLEGGLVQNDPILPVFDLDILDTDVRDASTMREMGDLLIRITEHHSAATDPTLIDAQNQISGALALATCNRDTR